MPIPCTSKVLSMFSSVFEKVVSTTAPGALATFPQPAALPVPASTLCCLSFADWFLKNYPVLATQEIDEDCNFTNLRLLSRAGVSGVAVSAHELDSVMQNAAKLGCRLAPALAGTSWSRPNESKMVSVSELLAKVRGIFGNRLTSVGRDIRVMRDAQAEKDENLLLRQIYTLKNAALETCNGQKWCIVVSSGGESLIVCSVPLPPTEVDRNTGCDFLVFDPWPRPTLKLQGSYIVKFTTVRYMEKIGESPVILDCLPVPEHFIVLWSHLAIDVCPGSLSPKEVSSFTSYRYWARSGGREIEWIRSRLRVGLCFCPSSWARKGQTRETTSTPKRGAC